MKIPYLLILFLSLALAGAALAATFVGESVLNFGGSAPVFNDSAAIGEVAEDHPAFEAIEAFNEGRDLAALRLAARFVEAGNPEALLLMGVAYEFGRGVEASRDQAIGYFRKAMRAGNRQSAYRLARLLVGNGAEDAREEARKLLESLAATKSDNGTAARMLGEGALLGWFGKQPDFDRTRAEWRRAAAGGDASAMFALGRLLDGEFGFQDKRDPAAALEYFLKAAELGNPAAMVAAGARLIREGSVDKERLGREWLDKALEKEQFDACLVLGDFEQSEKKNLRAARSWYRKGAESGQPACMERLGGFLLTGKGGDAEDRAGALSWFVKAGKAGNPFGHVRAARMLLEGDDRSKMLEGYGHLLAAAQLGLAEAQNEVALFYLSGKLESRDPVAAASWFSRASAGGLIRATFNLANMHERGIGFPQNFTEAGRLYTRAASAGHPQATTALARLNAMGLGSAENQPMAWALYSLAVERGDQEAKGALGDLGSKLSGAQLAEGRKILAGFKQPAADGGASE